jgi:transcriptional regulator with XRE-family HTH domain
MGFGELVRRSRLARGLSQSALATRIGVSQRYVSGVEHGEADNPTLETICTFARALELKFYELKPIFACALARPESLPSRHEENHA